MLAFCVSYPAASFNVEVLLYSAASTTIAPNKYSLNSIIRSPMTSEFWTELRRGPNYRVKTVLVIEL
jgi:hypothetical protein